MKKYQAKINRYTVYEHLEHYVKNTSYAQRWKMLEEMNIFANEVERLRREGKLFVSSNPINPAGCLLRKSLPSRPGNR